MKREHIGKCISCFMDAKIKGWDGQWRCVDCHTDYAIEVVSLENQIENRLLRKQRR